MLVNISRVCSRLRVHHPHHYQQETTSLLEAFIFDIDFIPLAAGGFIIIDKSILGIYRYGIFRALCKARAVTKTSSKLLTYRDLEIVCKIHVKSAESNKNNIHALHLKQAEYSDYNFENIIK